MKAIKKIMIVLCGLLALASCSDNDDGAPSPATKEQLQEVGGHWYAEISASGETDNWRTEEEGDVTTYDKIGAPSTSTATSPTRVFGATSSCRMATW